MNRRALLSSIAVIPLAACGGVTMDKVSAVIDKVPSIAEASKVIADALLKVMPLIEPVIGIGTVASDKVKVAIGMVSDAATAIQSVGSGGVPALVAKLADGVIYLTAAVTGYTLPAWVSTVIQASVAALPAIGINIPMAGHDGFNIPMAGRDGGMTSRQALAVLRAA